MNETAKHVIGKETLLERPCKIPPNVLSVARNLRDRKMLRALCTALMEAGSQDTDDSV